MEEVDKIILNSLRNIDWYVTFFKNYYSDDLLFQYNSSFLKTRVIFYFVFHNYYCEFLVTLEM